MTTTTGKTGITAMPLEKLLELYRASGNLHDISVDLREFPEVSERISLESEYAYSTVPFGGTTAEAIQALIESAGHNVNEGSCFWTDERITELGDLLRAVRDGNRADLESM